MSGCGGGGSGGSGGITHFLVSGDGHHVVMLAPQPPHNPSDPNPAPPPYAYSLPAHHAPYVLQNGKYGLNLGMKAVFVHIFIILNEYLSCTLNLWMKAY